LRRNEKSEGKLGLRLRHRLAADARQTVLYRIRAGRAIPRKDRPARLLPLGPNERCRSNGPFHKGQTPDPSKGHGRRRLGSRTRRRRSGSIPGFLDFEKIYRHLIDDRCAAAILLKGLNVCARKRATKDGGRLQQRSRCRSSGIRKPARSFGCPGVADDPMPASVGLRPVRTLHSDDYSNNSRHEAETSYDAIEEIGQVTIGLGLSCP
jgi:hypothetical protein